MKHYVILILLGLLATSLACQRLPLPTNPGPSPAPTLYFSTQWGINGYGIAMNSSGQVYILNGGVQELSATGAPITQWSTGMGNPSEISIDASGNVYVVNTEINNQIAAVLEYSSNGSPITQWGYFGTGNGQFEGPDGIAIGPNGVVYVSDNDYNPSVCRVEEFSSHGTYLGQWGSYGRGNGNGYFDVAGAIAVNASSGNVYVLDYGNHRVQEFSATGTYITQWGSYGSGNGQFESPLGVGIDPSGNVYVADGELYRIQEFTSSGAYITQWKTPAGAPGYFDEPDGVAINSKGIYISNVLMPPSIAMPI
jgi:hypothetical protein